MTASLRRRASAASALVLLCLAMAACGNSGPTGLQLTLTAPTDGSTVAVGDIFVVGTVNVNSAAVAVNGRHAHLADGYFSEPVHLHKGVNHIRLLATATGVPAHASQITVVFSPIRGIKASQTLGQAQPGSFVWRANAVCADLNNQIIALPAMTSLDAAKHDLQAMLQIEAQLQSRLQAITPSRSKAPRYHELVTLAGEEYALVKRGIDSAEAGHPLVLLEVAQSIQGMDNKLNHMAASLGLTECAATPIPSG